MCVTVHAARYERNARLVMLRAILSPAKGEIIDRVYDLTPCGVFVVEMSLYPGVTLVPRSHPGYSHLALAALCDAIKNEIAPTI